MNPRLERSVEYFKGFLSTSDASGTYLLDLTHVSGVGTYQDVHLGFDIPAGATVTITANPPVGIPTVLGPYTSATQDEVFLQSQWASLSIVWATSPGMLKIEVTGVAGAPGVRRALSGPTRWDGLVLPVLSAVGPPVLGTWYSGQVILDSAADAYLCITTGTPGVWKTLTGYLTQAAADLLYEPIGSVLAHNGDPGAHAGLFDPAGAATSAVGTHESTYDHTSFLTEVAADLLYAALGHTHALDDLSDVDAAGPVSGQVLSFDGVSWTNTNPPAAAGGAAVAYYLDDTASGVSSYNTLSPYPIGTPEQIDSRAVTSTDGELLMEGYSTSAALGRTSIDAGLWEFHIWCYVSSSVGTSEIVLRVYKRTSVGTETELFNTTTGDINHTANTEVIIGSIQSSFAINATDYLVFKLYAKTSSVVSRTLYFTHNGTTHYSHLITPLVIGHSALSQRDAAGSHTALAISNTAAGTISSTDVQGAINELDTEKSSTTHTHALDDLSDVDTSGVSDGKVLGYSGGTWGPVSQSTQVYPLVMLAALNDRTATGTTTVTTFGVWISTSAALSTQYKTFCFSLPFTELESVFGSGGWKLMGAVTAKNQVAGDNFTVFLYDFNASAYIGTNVSYTAGSADYTHRSPVWTDASANWPAANGNICMGFYSTTGASGHTYQVNSASVFALHE